MKRVMICFLAILLLLSSASALAEGGLLPTIGDVYGVDMPSMSAVVLKDPNKVETDKDGTKKVIFQNITEDVFNTWSEYIEKFGCSLVSYETEGSVFTAVLEKDGAQMTFSYDNEKQIATLLYPSGTNEEEVNYIERMFVVGNELAFGTFEQDNNTKNGAEPIVWKVIAIDNGKALLLSKFVLLPREFNDDAHHGESPTEKNKVTWENCTLNKWLNKEFLKSFSKVEQGIIVKGNLGSVFLLSAAELEKYIPIQSDRVCQATEYAISKEASVSHGGAWWWLRDTHFKDTLNNGRKMSKSNWAYEAVLVYGDGEISNGTTVSIDDYGVRPAIWIDFSGKGIQEWLKKR